MDNEEEVVRKYVVWKCASSHKPHDESKCDEPCEQWNITKTKHWNIAKGNGFPVWCRFYSHDKGRRRRLSRGDFHHFDTIEEAKAYAHDKSQEDIQAMLRKIKQGGE